MEGIGGIGYQTLRRCVEKPFPIFRHNNQPCHLAHMLKENIMLRDCVKVVTTTLIRTIDCLGEIVPSNDLEKLQSGMRSN
jgi:hypothetical protein